MQGFAYNTTEAPTYIRLSDVHDLESYYEMLQMAWVGYSTHIIFAIVAGAFIGFYAMRFLHNIHSEVFNK